MMTETYAVAERLLAGEYPYTSREVAELERAGVTLFVDLSHPDDQLDPYEPLLGEARRVAFPIPNRATPPRGQVAAILDAIDAARAGGETVYVHCWGGIGRTGTVVGCWLARHGLDRGDAVAAVRALRGDGEPSPETPAQEALVRSWRRGQ